MFITQLPDDAHESLAALTVPPDQVIAELKDRSGAEEQLKAATLLMATLDSPQVRQLRLLRSSLIYAGIDRYFSRTQKCRVWMDKDAVPHPAGTPGTAPCTVWEYHSRGLCEHHRQQWLKAGLPWGEGGLWLDSEPVREDAVGAKVKALELSGISPRLWQDTVEARVYPAPGGGWTRDRDAQERPRRNGFWRKTSGETVVELPDAEVYPSSTAHWTVTGHIHCALTGALNLTDLIRDEVRNPALQTMFGQISSNIALSALTGLRPNVLSRMRGQLGAVKG